MTLVVNPSAGRGRAGRVLPRLAQTLSRALPYTQVVVEVSTNYDDARDRTRDVVRRAQRPDDSGHSPDTLVVVGGDGMAHLGINACAETGVPLGIIPAGTGNDFCRGTGLPTKVDAALRTIAARQVVDIDLARVTGRLDDAARTRWVGCTVSSGYDAVCSQAARQAKLPLGALSYPMVALRELTRFQAINYTMTVDGERRELSSMLVALSNSGYFGGGMHVSPRADLHDGLLDVVVVKPLSKTALLRLLPTIYSGSHIDLDVVDHFRAREVTIDGFSALGEADGELLGPAPLTVTARPNALALIGAD